MLGRNLLHFNFPMHILSIMDLLHLYVAFTVKIKASTDVELGSVSKDDSLDDSKMEPNVYINSLTEVAGTSIIKFMFVLCVFL